MLFGSRIFASAVPAPAAQIQSRGEESMPLVLRDESVGENNRTVEVVQPVTRPRTVVDNIGDDGLEPRFFNSPHIDLCQRIGRPLILFHSEVTQPVHVQNDDRRIGILIVQKGPCLQKRVRLFDNVIEVVHEKIQLDEIHPGSNRIRILCVIVAQQCMCFPVPIKRLQYA